MAHPGIDQIRSLFGDTRFADTTLAERRASLAALAGSPPPPPGVSVERTTLADRPAERLEPQGAKDGSSILYLHGGGYCSGSIDTHRGLAGALALAAQTTVVTLDYRLAPEDPFPAGLNDALLAFEQLRPGDIALAGDSAGGGLAMATALALRDRGGAQPTAIWCLSPWVDLTQTSASMTAKRDVDPMLTGESLTQMAEAYLAGADPRSPLASPRFADLTGLPPIRIDVGSDEVLLDDSLALAQATGAELRIWPDMIHVFQAYPPELVPEAAQSIAEGAAFLTSQES